MDVIQHCPAGQILQDASCKAVKQVIETDKSNPFVPTAGDCFSSEKGTDLSYLDAIKARFPVKPPSLRDSGTSCSIPCYPMRSMYDGHQRFSVTPDRNTGFPPCWRADSFTASGSSLRAPLPDRPLFIRCSSGLMRFCSPARPVDPAGQFHHPADSAA